LRARWWRACPRTPLSRPCKRLSEAVPVLLAGPDPARMTPAFTPVAHAGVSCSRSPRVPRFEPMPGPLVSLCLAVALAAASGDGLSRAQREPELGVAELRQLLDGVPLAGMGAGGTGTGPIHPWRLFMARAPHAPRTVDSMLALL